MRKSLFVLPVMVTLAACGDPLSGIERVSELPEGLPASTSAAALPTQAEIDNREPIFAGLFRRNPPREDPAVEAAVSEAITGEVPQIAPSETVDDVVIASLDTTEVEAASVETARADPAIASPADAVVAAPDQRPQRGGVLTWLRRAAQTVPDAGANGEGTPEPIVASLDVDADGDTPESVAAVAPVASPLVTVDAEKAATIVASTSVAETARVAPEPQKRRGLFGGRTPVALSASRNGPDARDVPVGTVLPFGEVARVCDARPASMAKIVEKAAGKGRGYVLYDSAPDTASPRTFYVTGFDDNCPRQFTAALALFGTAELHEQLRYGLPAKEYPYSTTDEAYEKVKAKVCNVGRSKPCGARIGRLEKTTVFVSVYENFGENARWADLLLHDGTVLAAALKTP